MLSLLRGHLLEGYMLPLVCSHVSSPKPANELDREKSFREANSRLVNQDISILLQNPNVHFTCSQERATDPRPEPVVSSSDIFALFFIHVIIVSHIRLSMLNAFFHKIFPTEIFSAFISAIRAICTAYLFLRARPNNMAKSTNY
jgi:hypothetical protein